MTPFEPIIRSIPGGTLEFRIEREDIPLDIALAFAARRNPRRRFLFVSRILGRHIPTPPRDLRQAAVSLARKLIRLPSPCLFIGMAETATTLGQAVWREWLNQGGCESLYLDTTRRHTGGEVAFSFVEDHSHAPLHLVHRPSRADDPSGIFERAAAIIIVDDEVTTGRTAVALADAYSQWRGSRPTVSLLTLVHWKNGDVLPFDCHSLIEGVFKFTPCPSAPAPPFCEQTVVSPVRAPRGARHGITSSQFLLCPPEPAARVLVIGAGEFGFVPFLLAEQIEGAGGEAFVQATTRSPVLECGAIVHARSFPALDGSGYTEFLYNVPDDHSYERIILYCEGAPPPPTHPLWAVPRIEMRSAHE
ncbi:MAG: phosphoribosyltransferase domain-containing protein [Verrucomicrobiota bacterium]